MPMSPKSLVGNHTKGTSRAKCSSKKWCSRQIASNGDLKIGTKNAIGERMAIYPHHLEVVLCFFDVKTEFYSLRVPKRLERKEVVQLQQQKTRRFSDCRQVPHVYRSLDVFFLFCFVFRFP